MHRVPYLHRPLLLVSLLLLPLLAAQCGFRNRLPTPATPEPVELYWVSLDANNQVEELLASQYHETHPEVTFNRVQRQFNLNYLELLPPPDLMTALADADYVAAIRGEQLTDLGELWSEADLEGKLIPNVRRMAQDTESGSYFMLPVAFIWAGIYYNQAIFAQYQLEPPQTWDEFIQLCATLKSYGETPLAITGARSYAYTLWFDYLNLRINGADYHRDLLAGRESYADARVARVLDTWRSLFDQGFVVEGPSQIDDTDAILALVRGDNGQLGGEKAVMSLIDTYSVSQIPPKFLEELDFFPFPVLDPSVSLAEPIGVVGFVVPRGAAHGPQAQQFLTYLSSIAAQELLAQQVLIDGGTFAPVRPDLSADVISPAMRKAMARVAEAEEVVPFSFEWMPRTLWTGFDTGYRSFLNEEYDPQLFMDALEDARARAIAEGALNP